MEMSVVHVIISMKVLRVLGMLSAHAAASEPQYPTLLHALAYFVTRRSVVLRDPLYFLGDI